MKKIFGAVAIAAVCILHSLSLPIPADAASRLVIHPAPQGVGASPDYEVKVNGKPVFAYLNYQLSIYPTKEIKGRPVSPVTYAYFDFSGSVDVEITIKHNAAISGKGVVVRPLSLGINPKLNGKTITFTLTKPCNITVEPFDTEHPLELFTNPIETDIPDKNDPSVKVFKPGNHGADDLRIGTGNTYYFEPGIHFIDPLMLYNGQSLYVAGGAIIYANKTALEPVYVNPYGHDTYGQPTMITASNVSNVKIYGRGIINGNYWLEKDGVVNQLLVSTGCINSVFKDVIFVDGARWSLQFLNNYNTYIENLRVSAYYIGTDGICVSGCENLTAVNCFVHNADDSIFVKGFNGSSKNVIFKNCTVWNTVGQSFGVISEFFEPYVAEDIYFLDCTAIHAVSQYASPEYGAAMSVNLGHGGKAEGVVFDNMVVEHSESIKGAIGVAAFVNPGYPGSSIANVVFNNCKITTGGGIINPQGAVETLRISGTRISNIRFNNVTVNGKAIKSADDPLLQLANGAAKNMLKVTSDTLTYKPKLLTEQDVIKPKPPTGTTSSSGAVRTTATKNAATSSAASAGPTSGGESSAEDSADVTAEKTTGAESAGQTVGAGPPPESPGGSPAVVILLILAGVLVAGGATVVVLRMKKGRWPWTKQ